MKRADIIKHVRELVAEAEALDAVHFDDESFKNWQNKVFQIIDSARPYGSQLYFSFHKLRFGYIHDPQNPYGQLNNFDNALAEAISLLKKFERQVGGWQYYSLLVRSKLVSRTAMLTFSVPRGFFWGIVGAVIAAVLVALLLNWFSPLTGGDRNESVTENDAALYSLRPEIVIHPIEHADLRKAKHNIDTTIHPAFKDYYNLFFTIENVGNTPAVVDSIITEFVWLNRLYTFSPGFDGTKLSQTQARVDNCEMFLNELKDNYFRILIHYVWEDSNVSVEKLTTEKHWHAAFKNGSGVFTLYRRIVI